MKNRMLLTITLSLLGFLFLALPRAYALEETNLKLWGFAFDDANGNGLRDEDEAAVAGVTVMARQEGQEPLSTVSNEEGWYEILIGPGLWEVTALAPEAYALVADKPIQIEVLSTAEVGPQIDFALSLSTNRDGTQEPPADDHEATDGAQVEGVNEENTEETDDPIESEGADESDDGTPIPLLPESGAELPPIVFGGILAFVALGLGVGLLHLGRRL